MEKIELKQIFANYINFNLGTYSNESIMNLSIKAMKEACKQTLKLAAEKAETSYLCSCGSTDFKPVPDGWICAKCEKDPLPFICVDKQSILDVINLIE